MRNQSQRLLSTNQNSKQKRATPGERGKTFNPWLGREKPCEPKVIMILLLNLIGWENNFLIDKISNREVYKVIRKQQMKFQALALNLKVYRMFKNSSCKPYFDGNWPSSLQTKLRTLLLNSSVNRRVFEGFLFCFWRGVVSSVIWQQCCTKRVDWMILKLSLPAKPLLKIHSVYIRVIFIYLFCLRQADHFVN